LQGNDLEEQVPPAKQKPNMPNTASSLNKENNDLLDLSKAQSHRRRSATLKALREVHCTPRSSYQTPIMNGMWTPLVNNNSPQLMANSKVCTSKIIPNIVKKNVMSYEKSEDNFIRSTALLYKGGILTKIKYKEMRKEKVNFMSDVPVPRPVAYDRLMSYIKSINIGDVLDLQVIINQSFYSNYKISSKSIISLINLQFLLKFIIYLSYKNIEM
jgi:hypothetical protein